MGDYDDDKYDSGYNKQGKRLEEFQKYLDVYIEKHKERYGETLVLIPDAAQKITILYFKWLTTNVKPFVPKRINKYKISSLAELCIIKVQPFYFDCDVTKRKMNADFAFFSTLSIILRISTNVRDFNKPSGHKYIEDLFHKSKDQRLQWLEAKNPNEFPVFSNGLSLFLLFELYNHRFQSLAN